MQILLQIAIIISEWRQEQKTKYKATKKNTQHEKRPSNGRFIFPVTDRDRTKSKMTVIILTFIINVWCTIKSDRWDEKDVASVVKMKLFSTWRQYVRWQSECKKAKHTDTHTRITRNICTWWNWIKCFTFQLKERLFHLLVGCLVLLLLLLLYFRLKCSKYAVVSWGIVMNENEVLLCSSDTCSRTFPFVRHLMK